MTDTATEDLTAAGTLDGTEEVHLVQGGNSRKATVEEILTAQLPSTVARYWRLANLSTRTNESPSAAEIEFIATVGGSRLTGTASAASSFDGSTQPSNAQDANNSTIWAAANPNRCWYQLDLGAGNENTLAGVAIRARATSFMSQTPREFDIWSSDDGVRWKIHGGFTDTGGTYTSSERRLFDVSALTRP